MIKRNLLFIILGLIGFSSYAQQLQPNEVITFKEECNDLVAYLEFTLNSIGDNDLSPKEKDIIISDSYTKFFKDQKVQIEDDLIPDREAVTNKDVQAYLKDVDFFFQQAIFSYNILSTDLLQNENNQPYFKVHALRTLSATTLQNDSIYNEQARYIEVIVNPEFRELKIVSIYTTKINEKEENIKWWNDLPLSWKEILGQDHYLKENIPFSSVLQIKKDYLVIDHSQDSLMTLSDSTLQNGKSPMGYQRLDTLYYAEDSLKDAQMEKLHHSLNKILATKELNISGKLEIKSLEPVNKLSALQSLNVSGTLIDDLYPIRNLVDLQDLDISHSQIKNLKALVYSMSLRNLNISYSKVSSLEPIANLNKINILNLSNTNVDALDAIAGFHKLHDLRIQNTMVSDIEVLSSLTALSSLEMDNCPISNLESIAPLSELRYLSCNNTLVQTINPLATNHQLSVLSIDNTDITSLDALNGNKKLSKIYCDNTLLGKQAALDFMSNNPQVLVVYESRELQNWFAGLSPEWIDIFSSYVQITSKEPSKEELHQIAGILEIDLKANDQILSIEPLSQIQSLRKLNISETSIASIEALDELRDLKWLDMSNTAVQSLRALENNNTLDFLNISNSSIKDITALKKSFSLNKLYMENTPVSNINAIMALSGLRELKADHSQIEEAAFEDFILANPNCAVIYRSEALLSWWDGLSSTWKTYFTELQHWNTSPNSEELHHLLKRKQLNIENNRNISSIQELHLFSLLKSLKITGTQVNELSVLAQLQRLESIDLSQNPIMNLDVLGELTQLKQVNISDTQISYLDWLLPLNNLQSLDISGTQIRNLKALSTSYSLETLVAYNTRITNLKPLMELGNLKSLKIYNTKVSSKKVSQFKNAQPSCVVDFF